MKRKFWISLLIISLVLTLTACSSSKAVAQSLLDNQLGQTGETLQKEKPDPVIDFWDGQWYGWWVIWEGTGEYAGFSGQWWDVAAEIACDGDSAYMVLWEQDYPRSDPLGELALLIDPSLSESEYGGAVSTEGYFYTGLVESGDLVIDPWESTYENMLLLDGEVTDANGDTFSYSVCIRPWGVLWEDIEEELPDELPMHYYDWYLPLINAGKPIPDTLPADSLVS